MISVLGEVLRCVIFTGKDTPLWAGVVWGDLRKAGLFYRTVTAV